MFKAAYQGDTSVEVFTARGSSDSQLGLNKWRLTGSTIRKEFSKKVRGPIIIAQGSTSASAMLLPKDYTSHLGLVQPVVVLQACFVIPTVKSRCDYAICMNVRDTERQPHRLQFCSINVCRNDKNQTHDFRQFKAFVSEQLVPRGKWMNLFLDIESIMQQVYNTHLATVDSIQLSGTFKLRRIFTLNSVPDSAMATFEDVPSRYHFHAGIDFRNIVLQMQPNKMITKAIETGTDKKFLSVTGHNNSTSNLLGQSHAGGDNLSNKNDDDSAITTGRHSNQDKSRSTEQPARANRQKSAQSSNLRTTSSSTTLGRAAAAPTTTTTSSRAKGSTSRTNVGASAAMAVCQQQQKTLGNARRLEVLLKSRDKIATHLAAAALTAPGMPADSVAASGNSNSAEGRTANSASSSKKSSPLHHTRIRTPANTNEDTGSSDYSDEFPLHASLSAAGSTSSLNTTSNQTANHLATGDASSASLRRQKSPPASAAAETCATASGNNKEASPTALDELLKGDFLLIDKRREDDDTALLKPSHRPRSSLLSDLNQFRPTTDDDDSDFPVIKPKSPAGGPDGHISTTTTTSDSERDGNRTETIKRHESLSSIESSIANSNRTYTKIMSDLSPRAAPPPAPSTTSQEDSAISSLTATPSSVSSGATTTAQRSAARDRLPSSTATHRSHFAGSDAITGGGGAAYRSPRNNYEETASDDDDEDNIFSFESFNSVNKRNKAPAGTTPSSRSGSAKKSSANNDKRASPSSCFATLDCTADSLTSLSSLSDDGVSSSMRRRQRQNFDGISGDSTGTTTTAGGYESGSDASGDTIRAATRLLVETTNKMPVANKCDISAIGRSIKSGSSGSYWRPEADNSQRSSAKFKQTNRPSQIHANHSQLPPASAAYAKNHSSTMNQKLSNNSSSSTRQQHQHNLQPARTAAKPSGLNFNSSNNSHRTSPVDRNYNNTNKYNTEDAARSSGEANPKLRLVSARSTTSNTKWL